MSDFLNFRDFLQNENGENKENLKSDNRSISNNVTKSSISHKSNVENMTNEISSSFQTYSQGILAAINDKSDIRWTTFFISIPFGLFPWIFGLFGGNKVPKKYFLHNCTYEFVMGYKSKKRVLKFFPSFICWLTLNPVFYFAVIYFLTRINFPMIFFHVIREEILKF